MCHGTLLDFLQKGEGQHLQLPSLIDSAAQIASGMRYLEKEGYVHLDLRAGKILVGGHFVYKVASFPFVRVLVDNKYNMSDGGVYPIRWTAPEVLRSNNFTIKSDVWSFGVLLTELFTKGGRPYPGISHLEVESKVEGGYKMECPMGCPRSLYEIMLMCWSMDPADRPTFEFLQVALNDYCMAASRGENKLQFAMHVIVYWYSYCYFF